ncbi:hypothetical protein GGG16DRAFT_129649 [Schizophyllum commune]
MVPYALLRRDTTPRSSSDAVAVVPRMCPTRDSQAWETGGSRGASRPSSAMQNEARDSYQRPEPPKACVRTPQAKDAKVKAPSTLTSHSRRLCGSSRGECGRIFANPKPPDVRAGFLGEISGGGGTSTPLSAVTRGQREVLRTHSSRKSKGLYFVVKYMLTPSLAIFVEPKPPEARAGSLGEGRGRGGVPLAPQGGAASPLTPDLACARTLGEGCGRGGVPLPTRARQERGVAPINR